MTDTPTPIHVSARLTGQAAENYRTLAAWLRSITPDSLSVNPSDVIRYALVMAVGWQDANAAHRQAVQNWKEDSNDPASY